MLLNRLPVHVFPPRAVLLAEDVLLVSLPEQANLESRVFAGCEPPYGTVAAESASGPLQIAAMRQAAFHASPDGALLSVAAGVEHADASDPFNTVALGSDITALAEDLDAPSQRRLLAFLLGFCGKAFDLTENPDFATACRQLAALCAIRGDAIEPIAVVTGSWSVTAGWTGLSTASVFILGPQRVRRSTAPQLDGFDNLRLLERSEPNDLVVVLGKQLSIHAITPVRSGLPDLVRGGSDKKGLRTACLRSLAPRSSHVSAQLRESAVLSPATPLRHDDVTRPINAGLEAALSDGRGGLFLRGWIRDPVDLIASVELAGLDRAVRLDTGSMHRFRRSDIDARFASTPFADQRTEAGFVAFVEDPSGGFSLQPTLSLRLHSGAYIEVRAPLKMPLPAVARSAVLASVPPSEVTDRMLDSCIGPAAASFHRLAMEVSRRPELIQIGAPVANPDVSVIIPLYRNLSFLRFQLAAFARDPEFTRTEIIFVLDSPEQRREVEHLLRGLHALHGVPITLLALPNNLGYAAANNVGASHARGRTLLLLNSDVVPAEPFWLSKLTAALAEPGTGAVGPKLLFDDDSIQHAGLFFQRDLDGLWLNAHYHKGMPRRWSAAERPREVPGVTGAALLVRRELFEAVGGICEDYIIGDYEDSDFCLRLRAEGLRTTYVPSAELYHFERRSISLHKGYAGTLACRYNRKLHHGRWDDAIDALMTAPALGVAA